jgi:hypothetical protein
MKGMNKDDMARVERPAQKGEKRQSDSQVIQSGEEGKAPQEVADEDLLPL